MVNCLRKIFCCPCKEETRVKTLVHYPQYPHLDIRVTQIATNHFDRHHERVWVTRNVPHMYN